MNWQEIGTWVGLAVTAVGAGTVLTAILITLLRWGETPVAPEDIERQPGDW